MERAQQHGGQQELILLFACTAEQALRYMLRGKDRPAHQHELDSTL